MKAFTFLEVLLVIIIIGIIIAFGSFFYGQITRSNFILDETASFLINILKLSKEKSFLGEENDSWGVWLKNNTSTVDHIFLFKGSTSTVKERFDLPRQITFFDFDEKIIIFDKNSGETIATTVKIGFLSGDQFRNINIPTSGAITVSQ